MTPFFFFLINLACFLQTRSIEIDIWMRQLGDKSYIVRVTAEKHLSSSGPLALVALRRATLLNSDFEIYVRCERIIASIEKQQQRRDTLTIMRSNIKPSAKGRYIVNHIKLGSDYSSVLELLGNPQYSGGSLHSFSAIYPNWGLIVDCDDYGIVTSVSITNAFDKDK